MWMLFEFCAIIAAVFNVILSVKGKDSKIFMFASLSFTALTLCEQYALVEKWVANSDMNALESAVVGMPKVLWILTSALILINSIRLFRRNP